MSQRFLNPFFLVSAFVLVAFIYLLSANVVQAAATPLELQTKYKAATSGGPKVKILVMPGHEPNYGGTDYQGLYERER